MVFREMESEDGAARAEIAFSGGREARDEVERLVGGLGTLEPDLTEEDRRLEALAAAGGPGAADAAYELGRRYERGGWDDQAREMYRRAVELDDAEVSPPAGLSLGRLSVVAGDLAEAEEAFRRAADGQDIGCSAAGWDRVGLVRLQRGDGKGARQAFERAMAAGHPVHGAEAATNLGTLLFQGDDLAGAERAYREAVRLGSPPALGEATYNLAMICLRNDDRDEAEGWLQASTLSEEVEYAADGAFCLGRLRFERRDLDGAEEAWIVAEGFDHPEYSVAASEALAAIRRIPRDNVR